MQKDRELWDLLGRSPRPSAPPFFAGKVMRQIGTGGDGRSSWLSATLQWLAPATVTALAVFALLPQPSSPTPAAYAELTTLDIVEMISPDDYVLLTSAGGIEDDSLLAAEL